MKYDKLIERLQKLIGFTPKQAELCKILDYTSSKISARAQRNSDFSDEEIEKIEKHYGISLTGNNTEDCIVVDHIHIDPSCGKGTAVFADADITPIKLGTAMLQSVMKISHPQNLKTFRASGDSMESIIEDGDMLLVDTGRTDFNNGGIFLLTINNDWFVKRLRKRLSGELDVISDNKQYPVETFKPDDNIEIVIKGRVVKNLSRGL